jgi:hypothetical protein
MATHEKSLNELAAKWKAAMLNVDTGPLTIAREVVELSEN